MEISKESEGQAMLENGMIEPASIQDKREKEENGAKGYNLFADPDYLRDLAADLIRTDWERIKAEKGDIEP